MTSDRAAGCDAETFGLVVEYPDARVARLYEEHAVVEVNAAPMPAIGDVLTVIPNHACGTVNLHEAVLTHRGGATIGTWAVDARGRVR